MNPLFSDVVMEMEDYRSGFVQQYLELYASLLRLITWQAIPLYLHKEQNTMSQVLMAYMHKIIV